MFRRVSSLRRAIRPAAEARKNRKGRFPDPTKDKEAALNRLYPRSSNGRTPALQVRQSRSESWPGDQESVGPSLLEAAAAPDHKPRDLAPKL